jgi:Protein of unknown function (DUF4012)
VIYLEIGALILLVALISVSDLIYRRVIKGRGRRNRASGSRRFGAFRQHPPAPRSQAPAPQGSGDAAASASGPGEFVRVKLRSGRTVEGWREAPTSEGSSGSLDAFDLDVSSAFDPNGNPMSFPSDSFIVFTSQVERLDVLEPSADRKRSRELALQRQRTASTAPVQPAPVQPARVQPAPVQPAPREGERPGTDDKKTSPSEVPATDGIHEETSEGLGRVIQMPEPEEHREIAPAALLAPAPEPGQESPQVRRIEPAAAAPAAPVAVPPARRKRRSRPLVWIATVAIILVLALAADGFFTFFSLSHALDSARGDLRRGAKALLAGRYPSARAEFLKAALASGDADALQGHPSFWVVSHLPRVHRDAAALRALGDSSDLASQAGLDAVRAIHTMGAPAEGLAATIYDRGQINLNASQQGAPFFVDIEDRLRTAYLTLRAAPQPVFGAVQTALALALAKIAEAKDAVHKIRSLIQALPSLFGRDQARHYLLLFDNPSIARGSGGPIDFFGILTAESGTLRVGAIRPVDTLPVSTAARNLAPGWFRKAYGPAGAFTSWEQVTQSPSFNAVAPIAQGLYESATGTPVDGVIEMDPVALGLMSRAVGALSQPGFDVKVTAKNAVRVLTHDVYVHFGLDQHARDVWVAGLIEEVWKRVSRGDATAAELTTALGDSSKGSHFTMFASTKSDEKALNQVGVGATFSSYEPNVQMAVTNNRSLTRLGYYEHRGSSTVIQLTRRGQAYVKTTFQLSNSAPKRLERVLVHNVPSGEDQTDLSLVLPVNAQVQDLTLEGERHSYRRGIEGVNPSVTLPLRVAPGDSVRVICSYVIPHALDLASTGGVFSFATVPQATANPDSSSVTVIPPSGFQVLPGGSVGGTVQDGSYVATDTTGGPLNMVIKLAPPP